METDHIHVSSYELSHQLYALTNCGHKLETAFYYDIHGNVWHRDYIRKLTTKTLPPSFVPAYDLGYMRLLGITKIKAINRYKSKLKTALFFGEDYTCEFLIQMAQLNQIKSS